MGVRWGLDPVNKLTLAAVVAATALGATLRVYGLAWGAPYFHFHIDEHIVFTYANALARDTHDAAMSPKFFMYSPLPMYVLNLLVAAFNAFVVGLGPASNFGVAIFAAFMLATLTVTGRHMMFRLTAEEDAPPER